MDNDLKMPEDFKKIEREVETIHFSEMLEEINSGKQEMHFSEHIEEIPELVKSELSMPQDMKKLERNEKKELRLVRR